jgi:hypothetical protein
MISDRVRRDVESCIDDYSHSRLKQFVDGHGPYAIKFVSSQWAQDYLKPQPLKISDKPALTWGTATYVTPLAFPLSSALYGRVGLVTQFDPRGWKIFDATQPRARDAYIKFVQAQPAHDHLLLTVHATYGNHVLRDYFRKSFGIDCVLFHPDQEAEVHTDLSQHVWMAVTDWASNGEIATTFSARLANARFTVLIDEDFLLKGDYDLPVQTAVRRIERATEKLHKADPQRPINVPKARTDASLPQTIASIYNGGGYLHVYIEP